MAGDANSAELLVRLMAVRTEMEDMSLRELGNMDFALPVGTIATELTNIRAHGTDTTTFTAVPYGMSERAAFQQEEFSGLPMILRTHMQ